MEEAPFNNHTMGHVSYYLLTMKTIVSLYCLCVVSLLGKVEGSRQILSEQAMKPRALVVPAPLPHTSDYRHLSQALSNEDYYVMQFYGGNLCNGPVHEQIVVKVNTCFQYYDLQDRAERPLLAFPSSMHKFVVVLHKHLFYFH